MVLCVFALATNTGVSVYEFSQEESTSDQRVQEDSHVILQNGLS